MQSNCVVMKWSSLNKCLHYYICQSCFHFLGVGGVATSALHTIYFLPGMSWYNLYIICKCVFLHPVTEPQVHTSQNIKNIIFPNVYLYYFLLVCDLIDLQLLDLIRSSLDSEDHWSNSSLDLISNSLGMINSSFDLISRSKFVWVSM